MRLNSTRLRISLAAMVILTLFSMLPSTMQSQSVARQWNECTLSCIRKYSARPTVHARNLFHLSVVMYDAWAVYDENASPFFLGNTWGSYTCPFDGIPMPADGDMVAAQEKAISYAMYRTLWNRYTIFAPGANLLTIQGYINAQMAAVGFDPLMTSTDYSDGDPAKLGNYIAAKMQEFALQDGSNQQGNYASLYYAPVNGQIQPQFPGNPNQTDPNRWQTMVLSNCVDQNGIPEPCPLGTGVAAVGHEWGNVTPFSLDPATQSEVLEREGNDWRVYLDPGAPPLLDTETQLGLNESFFKWGFVANIIWHSFHNNDDGVMIDASPNDVGGLNITDDSQLPTTFEEYQAFYNLMDGGVYDPGHDVNPVTGLPYDVQMVPRKDFTRVLSQYWADGPSSETPPGHWFKIFNQVADHPELVKKWEGQGDLLSDLEWDVRGYFALGGGIHDAAVACWGAKGYYDYTRPIMAIRYMADRGQCTSDTLPHYHPAGLPLIPGYIELVESGDPLAGANDENVDKIKVFSWRGPVAATGQDGAGWLLGEDWWTYQNATFVTPPFAGYYSGHSTYSRTGAEIMTRITGDEYFPGGMAEYVAPAGTYLTADSGPSVEVKLQWATYRDASDQCSLSRIYGGLHPPQDDIPGRKTGLIIGPQAFNKANGLMTQDAPRVTSITMPDMNISDADAGMNWSIAVLFDEPMNTSINPVISYIADDASTTFIAGSGSWSANGLTFTQNYTIADANTTLNEVLVNITGAQDLDGNNNIPGVSMVVTVDTENPVVVSSSNENNLVVVNDAAVSNNFTLSYQYTFSEEMDQSVLPTISFVGDDASNTLVLDEANSAWADGTTFHAVFTLADNNEAFDNVDIQSASATDLNGNNLTAYLINDAVIVDTENPSVDGLALNTALLNDANAGNNFVLTFTFDEAMDTEVAPSIIFSESNLSTSLVYLAANSGWDDDHTFTCTYFAVDGNVELGSIDIESVSATDVYGNTQLDFNATNALTIDTQNPMVNALYTNEIVLSDADVTSGTDLEITVEFNDEMDNTVDPTLIFGNGNPLQNSLTFVSGSWSGNMYTATYSVNDANEELPEISIVSVDAVDDAGNAQQISYTSNNAFNIDTKNPTVVSISANTYNITTEFASIGFSLLIIYDEDMDPSVTPTITFPAENPTALTLNGGEWLNATTYQVNYTVSNVLTSLPDIDVTVSNNATDGAGNSGEITTYTDFFSINVVVSVSELSDENPIVVYPNPVGSGSNLNIEMQHIPANLTIDIYNSTGQLIQSINEKSLSGNKVVVSTENLSNGMYIVRVNSDEGRSVFNVSIAK